MIKGFLVASLLVAAAGAARAQETSAPLVRAQAAARDALAASTQDDGGVRFTPDSDSSVAPLEPLGNLRKVEDGFYRSAQPNKQGYALLSQMGVKTILTLKDDAAAERRLAEPLGMTVENVAMSGFQAPSFEEMDRALTILTTAPRPLLVHCEHGKDRTGFVVAAYRTAIETMSIPDAVTEARNAGCCFVMFGSLAAYLKDYKAHRRALR